MLQAFLNQSNVRDAALQRLSACAEAKQLTAGALFWSGGKGSVAGALVASADTADWQQRLGLAPWLAYALDAATNGLPANKAVAATDAVLNTVAPGADTSRLGSQVVGSLLAGLPAEAGLDAARSELQALHQRAAAGDTPSGAEWRAARKRATTAADGLTGEMAKALGACVEAAAWNPETSATCVGDVLRLWVNSEATKAAVDFGWSAEDDARMRQLLGEMHQQHIVGKPDEKRDVFMLLAEHHPAMSQRSRAYMRHQHDYRGRCQEAAATLLVKTLGAQP